MTNIADSAAMRYTQGQLKTFAPALTPISQGRDPQEGIPVNSSILPYSNDPSQFSVFKFDGNEVRVFSDENGEPLFVASDVCKVLGIVKPDSVYARLDDDEKDTRLVGTPGGQQRMVVVNESGLYNIILRSDKPAAKSFKRWITHDVIPAIRKTGSYSSNALSPLDVLKQMMTTFEHQQRQLAALQEHQAQQAVAIDDIAARLDDADFFTVLQWCQGQHIKSTASVRQMWGKLAKEASRARNIEIKSANEGQYNVGRYHKDVLRDVCIPRPKTHGQLSLLKG